MRALLLRSAVLVACAACSQDAVTSSEHAVVYGADDRQDVYAFGDAAWAARAQAFSAVVVDRTTLDVSDPDAVGLPAGTLQQAFELCAGERFATQLAAGLCSATLIAPDLVLTAGQCIDAAACSTTAFVFDYAMTSATVRHPITSADVYPCAAVVAHSATPALDYAVVRLDRAVVGRTPATLAPGTSPLALGRDLLVAGYPSGLPLKLAGDGAVRDPRAATTDFFVARLDTFGGGSGAGVFDARSKQLVGIAVRGAADYVAAGSCNRVNACPETGCRGQDATYAFRATAALCQTAPAPDLCKCGDATCDPAIGETTASCPADCNTACGDGACNGSETQASCAADCGTCGNGTCDGGETAATCCLDCGCAVTGEVCLANTCAADPVPGDSCAAPIALAPTGTQTVTGTTATAAEDFVGSCGGEGSPDRVYTFSLAGETGFEATVTGFDAVLYLRGTCGDAASELACDDDSGVGGAAQIGATLPAGDYALIVDGFSDTAGSYTLTATFTCTDSDLDGACDGADGCPQDPDKVTPGACGCGVIDDPTDGDGDGTADCADGCPADPGKAAPGACGCGVVEAGGDGDADGVADCFDQCPWSAHKSEPGVCGCGAEDADTDGDGAIDCPVAAPPAPTAAGCQASGGGSLAVAWLVIGLVIVRRRVR